jgi:hypothetical protein
MHKFISHKNLVVHKDCINFMDEVQSYSWDSKAGDRGKDAVVKSSDHLMDSCRYALATNFLDGSIDSPNEDISLSQRRKLAWGESDSWQSQIHGGNLY